MDRTTQIPLDLYNEFKKAGVEAKNRGQHVLEEDLSPECVNGTLTRRAPKLVRTPEVSPTSCLPIQSRSMNTSHVKVVQRDAKTVEANCAGPVDRVPSEREGVRGGA